MESLIRVLLHHGESKKEAELCKTSSADPLQGRSGNSHSHHHVPLLELTVQKRGPKPARHVSASSNSEMVTAHVVSDQQHINHPLSLRCHMLPVRLCLDCSIKRTFFTQC
ncbi:hypothetical protein GDO78_000460 [Eleutherodactylus coqui]|uniref:Uncharacterized protein n=1 Tax=Eleutherodactylus coqui TaxID=57060 RepID=A0A8J6KGB9_ELECQ|nr:hypothetical protein GDO78_000460 [Eleutherodactylus coqui]